MNDSINHIIAIDPGTTQSAWVIYERSSHEIFDFDIEENEHVCQRFRNTSLPVAIEMIASYGMPVGAEVFETCVWIGRFIESFGKGDFVYRKDVKMHLCNTTKAKDANIRQAILDLFPRDGGGKTPQIGTKNQPGALYGMKSHLWAALGVALTYSSQLRSH